jgi:hypothetical protein
MGRNPKVEPGPRRLKIGCGHGAAKPEGFAYKGTGTDHRFFWCPRCGAIRRGPHPNQWLLPEDARNRATRKAVRDRAELVESPEPSE